MPIRFSAAVLFLLSSQVAFAATALETAGAAVKDEQSVASLQDAVNSFNRRHPAELEEQREVLIELVANVPSGCLPSGAGYGGTSQRTV